MIRQRSIASLRQHFAQKISTRSWILDVELDDEGLAEKLGVRPELLREARRLAKKRRSPAFPGVEGQKKTEKKHPQLQFFFPKELWEKWHDFCELCAMSSNAALRGLVHQYLLGSWEPKYLGRDWRVGGRQYRAKYKTWQVKHARWPYKEAPLVTVGALEALKVRAERQNVTVQALLRGLVCEVLDRRLTVIQPIERRVMYQSKERYNLKEPQTGQ